MQDLAMALPPNIGLNKDSTDTAQTFTLLGSQTGVRRNTTNPNIAEPELLTIKHSTGNVAKVGTVDRHLVQFSAVKKGVDGVSRTLVVNMTLSVPRDEVFTANLVNDVVQYCTSFMSQSTVNSLLIGDS